MVIKAEIKDMNIVAGLAVLMWDNHSANELADDFSRSIEIKGMRRSFWRNARAGQRAWAVRNLPAIVKRIIQTASISTKP